MAAPQASSRLELLQARFQQKQLQEKERKLLELYDQQQQRAYQVVQRGSAGSTGSASNHSTTVSSHHQTVIRSSSSGQTNANTHAGKVRQMFDERRQGSVKGIDRSYPLEPLENKPRKQMNGNLPLAQKNLGMKTVTRSVTVKRVSHMDSSNGQGKPSEVSYQEELHQESFQSESPGEREPNGHEPGNENHVVQYGNGNGIPHESSHQVLDQDTIDNNRMMAKLHLMEFDRTMKHRVRNDLESEEFPEELMVEVPEKLPKRPVARKLSQAEARLERFKHANARRANSTKNSTGTAATPLTRKRSEPLNPSKSTLRTMKSPSPDPGTRKTTDTNKTGRRSIPSSPSNSPDGGAARTTQEVKPTRRPLPARGKTTASRKSTDNLDGAVVQENGIDQEAKQNSTVGRKADAFVIEYEDGSSKEEPKKASSRKQSTEKQQTSPMHSTTRPVSSISSVSSGSSAHGQTPAGPRGRMAARAKTPTSGSSPLKLTASARGPGNACTTDNLVPCKMCGRRFAQDRVTLHEQICVKTAQKKRKQFDTTLYRVRGTDLEPFVKKGISKKQSESKPKNPEVKNNWRRKHEDFINAIRSAKQVQAHLAAGGKLSDLPPPPASDTSDYVQCPHCGRKFNQAAAERHIPKCEHMLHNKPVHSRAPKPRR